MFETPANLPLLHICEALFGPPGLDYIIGQAGEDSGTRRIYFKDSISPSNFEKTNKKQQISYVNLPSVLKADPQGELPLSPIKRTLLDILGVDWVRSKTHTETFYYLKGCPLAEDIFYYA